MPIMLSFDLDICWADIWVAESGKGGGGCRKIGNILFVVAWYKAIIFHFFYDVHFIFTLCFDLIKWLSLGSGRFN